MHDIGKNLVEIVLKEHDLDDQAGTFALLKPEEIDVSLTEGMMMDPEASVGALMFHHPDCVYFAASDSPAVP